jgi:hypothetical protein
MKQALLTLFAVMAIHSSFSQTTWSGEAAQVFYDNCTVCHNPDGIGPNSYMTYTGASAYGASIQNYVLNNIMPPWTADTAYQHFSQERVLTQAERDILLNWISDGLLPGDLAQAPPPPVYTGEQILPGLPDLVVEAPNYMSKANFADDYVCFAIPSGLTAGRKLKAMEVIPGNRQTVHHCLVYYDNGGWSTTDTSGNCAGPVTATLIGGYTPGSTPIIFPSTQDFSAGMQLGANTEIVLAMHYPVGSYGTWDQTKVNFYFYDEPVANFREVLCDPIVDDWTTSFVIDADQFDSLTVSETPTPADGTFLSVFPHLHLLGYSIKTWGVTPTNDTINFCNIPLWDFDWQDFYWFEYMKYVPTGTVFWGKAVWDNTVNNPHNPNSPPDDVQFGLNTTDEMFLVYFHYMAYQAGDENINIDSLTTEYLSLNAEVDNGSLLNAYPNPFKNSTTISYFLDNSSYVSIYVYDVHGRVVKKVVSEQQYTGQQSVEWDGSNGNGEDVGPGLYFYSVMINGQNYSGKLIKR